MRRLLAAAAAAPLCFAALDAGAQTQITDGRTTPIATSQAGDIEITTSGGIAVTGGGNAVTVDSSNNLTSKGIISVRDTPGGTAVSVETGADGITSNITIENSIAADDTVTNTDTDRDGDLDGPFVPAGVVRYGIRVTGQGPLTGDITHSGGNIAVEGNDGSAGVSIEAPLIGNLNLNSTIGILGSDSFGVRVAAPVTGDIDIGGFIQANGERATGVSIEAPVSGSLVIQNTINSSGFRYPTRQGVPFPLDRLDADDLLIGNAAVHIASSIGQGLLINSPPQDLDSTDPDEDDDGIPDAEEGTGLIQSFGSAPALLIGSQDDIVLGNVGTSPGLSFGAVIAGQVIGNGSFDGISGTGARIGGLGGTVDLTDGIRITSQINGVAYEADANGLILGAGAIAPFVVIDAGRLSAGIQGAEGVSPVARALVIEEGAQVEHVLNNGAIETGIDGPSGSATSILDASGTVKAVTNYGRITAAINTGNVDLDPVGQAIAIDLRANTQGVDIVQSGQRTQIIGDVLFGTGAGSDNFSVDGGSTMGVVDFGGGSDNFLIGGGATTRADLRKSDGDLGLAVLGNLHLTNTNRLELSSFFLGGDALVTFTADPQNADPNLQTTSLNVNGDAYLQSGAQVDVEFVSKLNGPTTFEVLRATQLHNDGVDTSLVSTLPYIFAGQARVTGDSIFVDVRPRTASELGLTGGYAAAYEAFYAAFDADPAVAEVLFGKTDQRAFREIYEQFLPDYSGGPFNGLSSGTRAVFQAQAERAQDLVPGEPRSWLQEVGVGSKFQSVNDVEYQTGGLGFAGGFERPFRGDQVLGFSGSYISSEIRNANRAFGSLLTGSAVMSSVYWRADVRGMTIDASIGGGYAWFESNRRVVDQDSEGFQRLIRQANAEWSGALAAARIGVAYDWEAGPFYVRHDAVLDAVYLSEGGYTETGGGPGVNLKVNRRESFETAAEAGIMLGARFGRGFRWGPEVRVAYRGVLDGDISETTGAFVSAPDRPFILPGLVRDRQRIVVSAALRGTGPYANFALVASGDIGALYQAYTARLMVRFLF